MNKEEKIHKELEELKAKRSELKTNEVVIDYLNVEKMIELKKCELQVEHKATLMKKFDRCKHYYVRRKINADNSRSTCLFCGLSNVFSRFCFEENDEICHEYLMTGGSLDREQINMYKCDLDVAMAIIDKIKKAHKGIRRDELIKYFEIALDNMIDIKVNNDRVKSRAKRLGVKVTDIRKIRRGH